MNREIFREYDIRGLVEEDLQPAFVENLGKAYGTTIKRDGGEEVSVGYDARLSSPSLFEAFSKGVLSTGINVVNITLVPTPLLYYSVYYLDLDGGVMITGSHNPPEFNGFKLNLGVSSIHGKAIQDLADLIENEDFETGDGSISTADVIEPYIEMVKSKISLGTKKKIVVDAGNGCGAIFAPRLYEAIGAEVVELFCDVDGTFPNHHPDPTVPANLSDIIKKVEETGADAGIAFDGDADRIGIVDEKGNILFGDQLLAIFAREILARKPGAGIVFDVKCSQNLVDDITKRGGKPLLNPTGHSLIKARLENEKAELAGEMSAHIFFSDGFYGFDDAIYAGARFLSIMCDKTEPVSEYLADMPTVYNTPEIRVDCPDSEKFGIIEKLTENFRKDYDLLDLDGARVSFGEGAWGLVRASNTQPVLVLRFEARTEIRLAEIKKVFHEKLTAYPALANLKEF